jgi:predicted nucleotidyltransferase
MNIEEVKLKITPILIRYGIKRAAVFGSVARGEARSDSDVDLLVELHEPLGLFKFAQLNYILEDALNKKVDLVKNTSIKPSFKTNILREAIYIYG